MANPFSHFICGSCVEVPAISSNSEVGREPLSSLPCGSKELLGCAFGVAMELVLNEKAAFVWLEGAFNIIVLEVD